MAVTSPAPDAARPNSWARFASTVSERQVAALAELGRTMVSGDDYEQVLAAVIEKTARILDSSTGAFMLYDEETSQLILQKPAFGIDNESLIAEYRVPLAGGGNAVTVFVSGQPYLSNDMRNDPRILQKFAVLFDAVRTITVPLQIEGRSIGVFHVINKRSGDYTRDDLELLQLMAPQLAVIIQSALMLRQLREHERQLERIISVHNALNAMVLEGGDPPALAGGLARLLGMPVLSLEGSGRGAGAASLPAGLRAPAEAALASALGRIERAPALEPAPILQPVAPEPGGKRGRRTDPPWLMAVPIVSGTELLGALAAVGERAALDDFCARTLQQAAPVFALELVKEREVYGVEQRLQADAVEHLLVSETDAEAGQLLRRLGLDEADRHRVCCLQLVPQDGPLAEPARLHTHLVWLHRSAVRQLGGLRRRPAVVTRGLGLLLLLPVDEETPEQLSERLTAWVARLAAQVPSPPAVTRVLGIGGVARQPSELRRSFDEASTVVAVQARLGLARQAVCFEQLGVYRLLAQPSGSGDLQRFVEQTLGPLLAYERQHRAGWMPFLEELARANFSVKTAARRLELHVNTAKYRAARIQSLLGVDFADPDVRFSVQLALKIEALRSGTADRPGPA